MATKKVEVRLFTSPNEVLYVSIADIVAVIRKEALEDTNKKVVACLKDLANRIEDLMD